MILIPQHLSIVQRLNLKRNKEAKDGFGNSCERGFVMCSRREFPAPHCWSGLNGGNCGKRPHEAPYAFCPPAASDKIRSMSPVSLFL